MKKKIYITGMHSGQNPSSGLSIIRSIRKAFPDLTLVGTDHWQGASGLHDRTTDETLLLPKWNQISNELLADDLRKILNEGNLWIAAMDMEVHWLAENFGEHPNLLAPNGDAIERTAKPAVTACESLGFRVPEFIPANLPDSVIHSFLRQHSWQCWLKSPYHDAKRISSWVTFERCRESLAKNWKTSKLFLQSHVVGNEETVAFSAYQGELLSAARLQKRQLTPEGKTWAGRVSPVEPEFFERLKEIIKDLKWTGGGELEYVRDSDDQKWIIECNPRFPAWIYGAAIAGLNVVGDLISKVWGIHYLQSAARFPLFTRVVYEIPAKEEVGIPLPADPSSIAWTADKHGKTGPSFADFLPDLNEGDDEDEEEDETESRSSPEPVPPPLLEELHRFTHSFSGETPARIHLESWSMSRFEMLAAKVAKARKRHPEVRIGYSVKTSPTDDNLRKAKASGFFAECISQMEVRRALEFGFKNSEIILNGPGKFWPLSVTPATGLHMLFCDSLEEFERVLKMPKIAGCLGFRMRVPKITSRFGNALEDFGNFQKIVKGVRELNGKVPLGFHFHMPSWMIGVERWMEALESLIVWCQALERLTNTKVRRLDLGGGFFPADLESLDFGLIQAKLDEALPDVQALYFEPGRSLTQDTEAIVSRVLDVRKNPKDDELEIVVDACVAELPLAQSHPHRIFFRAAETTDDTAAVLLKKGKSRILGRICMEDDILGHQLEIPQDIKIGDFVIFGDAGGYERSMSYGFGRG